MSRRGNQVVVAVGVEFTDVQAGGDTSREQSMGQGQGHIQAIGSCQRRLKQSGTSQSNVQELSSSAWARLGASQRRLV